MEINNISDYIHTAKLNLDLEKLKIGCKDMMNAIENNFWRSVKTPVQKPAFKTAESTTYFDQYNLLMYPFDQFHELYNEIKQVFHTIHTSDEKHYIQCWLNHYNEGDFIDYHSHWLPEKRTWHGFVCVDCEPSKTTYRLPKGSDGKNQIVDVPSINNTLVISKSNGDLHRTWPWPYSDRPRLTIAFDIIPRENVQIEWLNHWVPI
jgi:hypothetical protein